MSSFIRDMGIAGLNLKFNKKVKTNVERESIFIFKSHQTGPQFQKSLKIIFLKLWPGLMTFKNKNGFPLYIGFVLVY